MCVLINLASIRQLIALYFNKTHLEEIISTLSMLLISGTLSINVILNDNCEERNINTLPIRHILC